MDFHLVDVHSIIHFYSCYSHISTIHSSTTCNQKYICRANLSLTAIKIFNKTEIVFVLMIYKLRNNFNLSLLSYSLCIYLSLPTFLLEEEVRDVITETLSIIMNIFLIKND